MPRVYKKSDLEIKNSHITTGVNHSTKAQRKKISKIKHKPKDVPTTPTSQFYMRVNGRWIHKGTSCRLCEVLMNDPYVIDNHKYVCAVLNTKKKEILDMPIHRITRGGQTYYRYGETGKEYRTLAEAERQAAAIKASQAREKEKKKK